METNRTFYQNEIRNLKITIYDQDHTAFEPDTAYASVEEEDETEIVAEQAATINGNDVYITIGTSVTENTGTYYVIWKIVKDGSTYYHKTRLMVMEL